ncbi:hypothetical protein ACROYT_G040326 [Oculina patagonica]
MAKRDKKDYVKNLAEEAEGAAALITLHGKIVEEVNEFTELRSREDGAREIVAKTEAEASALSASYIRSRSLRAKRILQKKQKLVH